MEAVYRIIEAAFPHFLLTWVIEMIKRFSAFLLAVAWVLALSACGASTANPLPSALVSDPAVSVSEEPSAPLEPGPAETEAAASEAPEPGPVETEEPASETPEPGPVETEAPAPETPEAQDPAPAVDEDGWYDSKEDVALYIHLYGHLPDNYVTKREAQDMGWSGGGVERYTGEGTAIGGSRFGNYEGLLPEAKGRSYTECDIGTVGGSSRGAKRIVFSNDGLIYYTGDHYQSFELLYGEP